MHVIYAAFMAVLYCFGIPAASWVALNSKKEHIQKLQLLSESTDELNEGGTLTLPGTTNAIKNANKSQQKKSILHQDLVATATRRFSGVGLELDDATGAALKAKLLKLEASMKENDPWLAGLSPLYKDYEFAHWWFEVCHCALYFSHPHHHLDPVFGPLAIAPLRPTGSQICRHFDFVWPCNLASCGGSDASFYFACDVDGHADTVCEQQPVLEQK